MSYDLFEKIEYKNLLSLVEICKRISLTELIKIEYSKKHKFLRETLNFLLDLNLLKIQGNNLIINKRVLNNFDKQLFIELSKNVEYGQTLKEYLLNFSKLKSSYIFKPNSIYNTLTSDLRNFLISAKKIKYKDNIYHINDLSILELVTKKEFSPSDLEKVLKNKKLLGLEAELLVCKKEQEKIKKINSNLKIDHIAKRDVSAGYDIQSFDKNEEGILEKIYIEVKAVSKSNYKFYLSIREKQTAIKLKNKYFIYLLPVDRSNSDKFDYNKLLKITNIDQSIFRNKIEWKIENDGYVIFKN